MQIELAGVHKRFGPVRALQGVSLRLSGGDLLLLTGPNGSGKSTLLHILATALAPDEGQYIWDGRPMRQAMREMRKSIGLLGENAAMYEDLSAEENLHFWAGVYGVSTRGRNGEHMAEALEMWALMEKRHQPVRALSQGMRKRLGLAKLSLQNPLLVLLDEPFNGLDSQNTSVLLDQLRRWKAAGKTIALATHQQEIVADLATQHMPMKSGDRSPISKTLVQSDTKLHLEEIGDLSPDFNLLRKDMLLEWKAKDLLGFLFVFALSVLLLFSFAWNVSARDWPNLAPGILWVIFLFAGVLSFQRGFALEKENHCLEALLISPLPRSSIFLAKALASLIWLTLLGVLVYPVFFILHDLPFWNRLGKLLLIHVVGNAGFVCLGVLLSGVSSHARNKEALLPILMFPLCVPLFIGAIEATGSVLREGIFGPWFGTLCSIAAILCTVSWLLCDWVWEER